MGADCVNHQKIRDLPLGQELNSNMAAAKLLTRAHKAVKQLGQNMRSVSVCLRVCARVCVDYLTGLSRIKPEQQRQQHAAETVVAESSIERNSSRLPAGG